MSFCLNRAFFLSWHIVPSAALLHVCARTLTIHPWSQFCPGHPVLQTSLAKRGG
jgi:hypothetical protein